MENAVRNSKHAPPNSRSWNSRERLHVLLISYYHCVKRVMVYIVSFSSIYQDPSMNTLQCILFFPFFSGLSVIFGLRFVILKKKNGFGQWILPDFVLFWSFFVKTQPLSFVCTLIFFVVVNSTLNKVNKGYLLTNSPYYRYMNLTEYC